MKKYLISFLLLLLMIFSFSCSYMKTDLGDSDIEVKIITLRDANGSITGLKLAFNKVVSVLNIQSEIDGKKVIKLSFADVIKLSTLTQITIPDTVTEIDTFAGAGFKTVTLPEGLQKLPSFKGCSSLTEITVPAKITEIPDSCFVNCSAIKKIEFKSEIPPEFENTKTTPFPTLKNNKLEIVVPEGSEEAYWDKWSVVDWKTITLNEKFKPEAETETTDTDTSDTETTESDNVSED